MPGSDSITGWTLDRRERVELLQQFPPRYRNVVADHVTLKFGASGKEAPPGAATGEIVGRADDGRGVECLVVRIGGTTDRPDGGMYHITWSLADGRMARESNDVLKAKGWKPIALPMPVQLTPARWPR